MAFPLHNIRCPPWNLRDEPALPGFMRPASALAGRGLADWSFGLGDHTAVIPTLDHSSRPTPTGYMVAVLPWVARFIHRLFRHHH